MDTELFCEGSIYYYENKSHTKKDYHDPSINQDFIVSRPVYILKNQELPFDTFTINVLIITSSVNRVGIPINIDGFKDGKILPYAVHSVHRDNLVKYMGQASDKIMDEVREARKYHDGYTAIKPSYLVEYENRVIVEKEFINQLSLKEKTVYSFLKEKCLYNNTYMVEYEELFKAYKKYSGKDGYTRSQDFSRILNKQLTHFPGITMATQNKIKSFYGMSLNGNVHKISTQKESNHKKRVISDPSQAYDLINENAELYDLLSSDAKSTYDKLDIIEKIEYYHLPAHEIEMNGMETNDNDKKIIKKMLINDIDKRKEKIFHKLESGLCPLNMNATDQYILYICSNSEIRTHVKPYYIRSGGVNQLKKEMRKNIKHYFAKLK